MDLIRRDGTHGIIIKVGVQGPEGKEGRPYGVSGTVIYTASKPFSFRDVSGQVAILPADAIILEKEIEITTLFDGNTPRITIGTDDDNSAFLSSDSSYLKMEAQHTDPSRHHIENETVVKYFLTLDSATQGAGFVNLKYSK